MYPVWLVQWYLIVTQEGIQKVHPLLPCISIHQVPDIGNKIRVHWASLIQIGEVHAHHNLSVLFGTVTILDTILGTLLPR